MTLIEYRRHVSGMSGHETARWLGVKPSIYWRWEQGQMPSPVNMRAIYRFTSGAVTPNCLARMGRRAVHPLFVGAPTA